MQASLLEKLQIERVHGLVQGRVLRPQRTRALGRVAAHQYAANASELLIDTRKGLHGGVPQKPHSLPGRRAVSAATTAQLPA